MKIFDWADKEPKEVIPSINSIHRSIMRIGGGLICALLMLYTQMYLYFFILLAVFLVFMVFLGGVGYLFVKFDWYRRWVGWVALVNVLGLVLMLWTESIWWIVLPLLFEFLSNQLYIKELIETAHKYGIPYELPKPGEFDDD